MNTVFLAYIHGDFDISVVIGVGTDILAAEKIIKDNAKKLHYTVRRVGENKFKRNTTISHDSYSDSDYDYWIEEVKVNKPL